MSDLLPRPVSRSTVQMTELVLPQHTNAIGSIFGGQIMAWVDIASAIAAQRHSGQQVVTASIDALNFVAPVYKGWVVNLRASVNYAGRTSMEVGVRIDAENTMTLQKFHTASAYLTFVAVDKNGKPTLVPPVLPESDEQRRRFEAAQVRRAHRLQSRG